MKKIALLFCTTLSFAQTYTVLNQEKKDISYRGLAIESDSIFLVSGTKNSIAKTSDRGETFEWINPKEVDNRDFRDIEILDKNIYLALGISTPAYILLTQDGGKTWNKVYVNTDEKIFLNAITIKDNEVYVIGDPIHPKVPFILKAKQNQLNKWDTITKANQQNIKLQSDKEAFFSSSGSNIYIDNNRMIYITGGDQSNIYHYTVKNTEIHSLNKLKTTTSGANGLTYDKSLNIGYIVGGDFTNPTNSTGNFYKFKIKNDKLKFIDTKQKPNGYKSGVTIISKNKLLVCGYSGVDYSKNGGKTWETITTDSYNTCKVSPNKKQVILVGNKGKIGKIDF